MHPPQARVISPPTPIIDAGANLKPVYDQVSVTAEGLPTIGYFQLTLTAPTISEKYRISTVKFQQ